MEAAERQPATGQLAIQRRDPEGKDLVRTRAIAFWMREAAMSSIAFVIFLVV